MVGGWWLRTLGLLIGLFAVSAAIGAPPAGFPPALWVNHETVRSRFDLSVQHLRAFWAALGAASLAGWGRKAAPETTRRLGQVLLATLASLLLLGAATVYYRDHLLEEEHLKAERAARDVARTVEHAVRANIDGLEQLAMWAESEGGPALEGDALPAAMRRRFPLLAAGIAETGGQITHVALLPRTEEIVTYPPLDGTDALARLVLSAFRLAERRAEAATDQIRRPVLTGPILRSDGLPTLLGARTVITKHGPWGVVAVTVDLRTQFENASHGGDQSFAFTLSDGSGRYVTGAPSSVDQTPETAEVSSLGAGWRVEALPPESWDARVGAALPGARRDHRAIAGRTSYHRRAGPLDPGQSRAHRADRIPSRGARCRPILASAIPR